MNQSQVPQQEMAIANFILQYAKYSLGYWLLNTCNQCQNIDVLCNPGAPLPLKIGKNMIFGVKS